ncbi:transcriptional regulator [Methylorubrum zatmanii]|nr:helix-turn-helix transcriptional regulator [Methylorubrum zatmanii]ARO54587.1 transcriptional regulator [Methylorubrum zatmanii]
MSDEKFLSSAQCRAARAMLNWNREELAAKCGVSRATLADFEADKRNPYDRTLADIRRAFEAEGLEFIPENGGGAGIRFRNRADGTREEH